MSRKENYMDDENYVPKAFKQSKNKKEIDFEKRPYKSKRRHETKKIKKLNIKRNKYKENKYKKSYIFCNNNYNSSISY